jgi:hypothetical protein
MRVFVCYFVKLLHILMVLKMQKKKLFKRNTNDNITLLLLSETRKYKSSSADRGKVSQNAGTEIFLWWMYGNPK